MATWQMHGNEGQMLSRKVRTTVVRGNQHHLLERIIQVIIFAERQSTFNTHFN